LDVNIHFWQDNILTCCLYVCKLVCGFCGLCCGLKQVKGQVLRLNIYIIYTSV